MNVTIYHQLYSLFIFSLIGIFIGLLFDVFRILRKSFRTPDIVTIIEDIIFWILVGGILLFSVFKFNNGELRSYIFIGLILGIIVYILTISRYIIKISVKILMTLKNIFSFPLKKIYQIYQNFTKKCNKIKQ